MCKTKIPEFMLGNALMKGNYKELKNRLSITPQMAEKQHWPSKICTCLTLVYYSAHSHHCTVISHITSLPLELPTC